MAPQSNIQQQLAALPFGRRVIVVGPHYVLQCRCDAAALSLPLRLRVPGSYCQFCGIHKPKPTAPISE